MEEHQNSAKRGAGVPLEETVVSIQDYQYTGVTIQGRILSSYTKDNTLKDPHLLRRQIRGLIVLLSIISPRIIAPSQSHTSKKPISTVDDLLIRIVTILNSDAVDNLVGAIFGASVSIMDLTLVVVCMEEQIMGACSFCVESRATVMSVRMMKSNV